MGIQNPTKSCEPALLLDESCLNQLDYSLGLLGKVKEFSSFDNMRMVLGNEGFDDINLRHGSDNEKGEFGFYVQRKSNKIEIKKDRVSLLNVMEELIQGGKDDGFTIMKDV
ncbi:hypothetical protein Tco_0446689 [Tanacetum coccineum]